MADEQALPVHHTKPYNNYNFQSDGTSRTIKLGLFFPVNCFIRVFLLKL